VIDGYQSMVTSMVTGKSGLSGRGKVRAPCGVESGANAPLYHPRPFAAARNRPAEAAEAARQAPPTTGAPFAASATDTQAGEATTGNETRAECSTTNAGRQDSRLFDRRQCTHCKKRDDTRRGAC